MKAIVSTGYGGPEVLGLKQVPVPVPKADEVLLKMRATVVTSADVRLRQMSVPLGFGLLTRLVMGMTKPRNSIPGAQIAAEVEQVGDAVTRFKRGDRVLGTAGLAFGAYAQFVCVPEKAAIAPLPARMTFEQGAALSFGGTTALYFLKELAKIRPGQSLLVYGASGDVGTFAVQLACHFGAEVTGVCSTENLELVRSLGAHHVVDYTRTDFTKTGQTYDFIFDTVGKTKFSKSAAALAPDGIYLAAVAGLPDFARMAWTALFGRKKFKTGLAADRADDITALVALVTDGKIAPVIDRTWPLAEIAAAHAYVDTGRKRGSVVITIAHKTQK